MTCIIGETGTHDMMTKTEKLLFLNLWPSVKSLIYILLVFKWTKTSIPYLVCILLGLKLFSILENASFRETW